MVSTSRVLHGFAHRVIKGTIWATTCTCLHPIWAATDNSPYVTHEEPIWALSASRAHMGYSWDTCGLYQVPHLVSTSRVLHGFAHRVIKGTIWATPCICLRPTWVAIPNSPHPQITQIAYVGSVGIFPLPSLPARLLPFPPPQSSHVDLGNAGPYDLKLIKQSCSVDATKYYSIIVSLMSGIHYHTILFALKHCQLSAFKSRLQHHYFSSHLIEFNV